VGNLGAWVGIARANRASALVVLGLLLGLASLLGPWFTIDVFTNGTHDPVVEFSTTTYVTRSAEGPYYVVPYESIACRCASVAGAFNLALVIVGVAVLIGAAAGVAFLQGRIGHDIRVGIALIVGLMLAVAPGLLAISLPGAFAADDGNVAPGTDDYNWQRGFIGQNTTQSTVTISWGPGWAWVTSLLGGLAAIAGAMLSRKEARPRPTAVAPAMPASAPPPPPVSPPPGGNAASQGSAFPAPSVGGDAQTSGKT
jgi:hypothetical protein